MDRIIRFSLLFLLLAYPAYAGRTVIRETDAGFIAEYTPDEGEAQAVQIMKEKEEQKREAEEENNSKIEEKNAAKRAKSEARKVALRAAGEEE